MTMGMDVAQLGKFSPFNALKYTNLDELLEDIEVLQATQGQVLFKKDDADKRSLYLLSGTIELRDGDQVVSTIEGGSDEACNPIAPLLPRRLSAVARGDVRYFSIDSELLDELLHTLDARARFAVEARFGLVDGERKSFREVGEQLGVTAEAARRLVSRAVAGLRDDAERILAV